MFSHGFLASVRLSLLDGPSLLVLALAIVAAEHRRLWMAAALLGVSGSAAKPTSWAEPHCRGRWTGGDGCEVRQPGGSCWCPSSCGRNIPGAITRVVFPLTLGFRILLARWQGRGFWLWYGLGNLHVLAGLNMLPFLGRSLPSSSRSIRGVCGIPSSTSLER